MQSSDGVIKTDTFTLSPVSMDEVTSFLNAHLGTSLIEIMKVEHYHCECLVNTAEGEKVVSISLPARYHQENNSAMVGQ